MVPFHHIQPANSWNVSTWPSQTVYVRRIWKTIWPLRVFSPYTVKRTSGIYPYFLLIVINTSHLSWSSEMIKIWEDLTPWLHRTAPFSRKAHTSSSLSNLCTPLLSLWGLLWLDPFNPPLNSLSSQFSLVNNSAVNIWRSVYCLLFLVSPMNIWIP